MDAASSYSELERSLGYTFARPELLERSLVHRSWAHDQIPPHPDNERLEFLGDAVLELVISEFLVREYPKADEGRLSRARAMQVRAASLARQARRIGLGHHVRLGRQASSQGGEELDSVLSDTLEAVIGAVYRDGGLEAARRVVLGLMKESLARRGPDGGPWAPPNPRNELQEILQKHRRGLPVYEVTSPSGTVHAADYLAEVRAQDTGELLGSGKARSKKGACEAAALAALEAMEAGS